MTSDESISKSRIVPSEKSALEEICQELLACAADNSFDEDDLFAIHLAMEEAFLNAVKHGNKFSADKHVGVKYAITPAKFEAWITDDGPGFDPETLPDPRCKENLYKNSGRGVLLMRAYMDVVEFNETGNTVHIVKYSTKAKKQA